MGTHRVRRRSPTTLLPECLYRALNGARSCWVQVAKVEPVVQREQGFVVLLKPEARYGFIKCVPGSCRTCIACNRRLVCLLGGLADL